MSLPQDPLSRALRAFLQNQVAGADRLHFATLPQPVRSSQVTDEGGAFDQTQANEVFSRDIADKVAILDGDVRQARQGSFADLLRYGVIDAARFFAAPDRSSEAISHDRTAFEAVLAQARKRMEEVASLAPIPATYMPSRAIPADWSNPFNAEGWNTYTESLTGNTKPKQDDTGDPPLVRDPVVPLIIRRFNPALIEGIPRPIPKRFDPGNIDPIPDYLGREALNPHRGWSDWSNLRHPTSFERFTSLGPSNPLADLDALSVPLGADVRGQSAALSTSFSATNAKPIVKIEDLQEASASLADVGQSAFLNAHTIRQGIEVSAVPRNAVDVSLEYMAVRIERPWIFQALFANTNWYVPDMRRGQVSRGEGEKSGVRDVVPEAFVVVRNVRIRAGFGDADAKVLDEAFAIGPFAIDREASVVAGELKMPGMQIIAYIDVDLPAIPPRSDPNILV